MKSKSKNAQQNKPLALGTVWNARARIQRINGTHWETLATCMDTPNAIKAEAQKLVSKGYQMHLLWVLGDATGRKMIQDLFQKGEL